MVEVYAVITSQNMTTYNKSDKTTARELRYALAQDQVEDGPCNEVRSSVQQGELVTQLKKKHG